MTRRNKLLSLLLAACLIIGMMPAAVSAQGKTPVVDKDGTDGYAGNAILAENLDFTIDSDKKLAVMQPLGINNNQAAGSPGKTAENAAENPEQLRCGNLYLPQHDFSEAELPSEPKKKSKTAANTYNVGDVKTIHSDYYDGKEADFAIEVAAVGDTCTIWRSVEHRDQLTTQQAQAYADALDTRIHGTMETAFGSWSNADVDGDGKTAFVFYPMSFAGFFYGADLFTKEDAEWATGNVMDMLHMSTKANDTSVVLSTLVHELQHLINFAQTDGYCDSWLNETFSQSAIAVTGLSSSETVYEVPILVDFANENGYSAPFIYKDWYVPSSEEMTSPPYGSWYLFGRYLAHQTEGMTGGGNAIYKSILSQLSDEEAKAGDYLGPEDLEDALKAIGYIGGENSKASDIEEVITNYNIALYLREPSGIYSLSNNSESPSNVDGVQVDKIFQTSAALKEIPGGGTATLVINENMESAKPENPGTDIRFAGIETEFMNGAYAENADATMIWGDKITLESMDGPDSEIKYTTDGSKPFAGGQVYTEPIVVTEPMTLSFCTVSKDGDYSQTETVIVEEIIAASVKAGHPSGPVEKGTEITLSTDMNDATIRYTTDGSAPSKDNGAVYEDAIKIETTTTVKAVAYSSANEDILLSDIKTFVYEVEDDKGDRYEKNDTKDTATALSFPGEINATIHNTKDSDWYSFTLDNGAALSLTLTPPAKSSFGLYLYDENGDRLAGSARDNKSQNIRCEAKSGRYYLKVESTDKSFSAKNAYTLSLRKEMDADALADLDFSEMNMFTALSDKSETGSGYAYDLGIDGGGHFLMSMAYFANWDGPVDENFDRYPDVGKEANADLNYKDLSSKAEYHVQNALYLPNDTHENFIEHVKNAVYSYGAADIYILSAKAYQTEDFKHFYLDGSYEYPNPYLDGGHAVTIVGWDDKYSKDNFIGNPDYAGGNELPKPKNNGAFIVKNSWGDKDPWGDPVGDDGYFYLSYEDASMLTNTPAVYITDEASDNYNHQYYNDIAGAVFSASSGSSFAAEEHFTNESSSPELLKATSFQLMSSDTRYEIFATCNGETKKVSEGVKKYAGFYTERLAEPVLIPAGSDFSVKVYLESTEENEQAAIGFSANYGDVVSCVEPQSGIAFIEANGTREDVGAENAWGAFPCIRAYTCDVNTDSYIKTTPDSSVKNSKKAATEDENTNKTEGIWEDISMAPLNTETTNGITTLSLPDAGDTDVPDRDLPEEFDLRDTGTLTPVRNQGNLGSCWTFAAMASAENTAARNGGFTKDYPESITLDSSEKSVLLSKDSGEIPVELTAAINGSENPASTKIFWSVSGDADSVRLDNTESFSGEKTQVLTAIKPGVVTITASSDADMSVKASCTLTITAQGVEKIVLDPTEMTMKKGESKQIKAQTGPDNAVDSTIIWKSSNPEIAAVDSNGNVTAISGGKAVITAKAGTAEAQTVVTVKGDPAVNPGSSDGNGSSKTGDDTNIILWAALALLAAAGAGGSVIYRNRNKKRHDR